MSRFFIERPIFAWVVSIVIVLIGGVAAFMLPIAQYPDITPPTVQVNCTYPGANAQVVAGYTPSMPTYAGTLSDEDIEALIEFIKAQK